MAENSEIVSFFNNISKGLKKYSIPELNAAILEVLNRKENKNAEIDFVMQLVIIEHQITLDDLKTGPITATLTEARQHAYCLLHLDVGLSMDYIAKVIFNNWKNSIFTGIKRLRNVDPRVNSEIKFLERYKKLQTKLANHIAKIE